MALVFSVIQKPDITQYLVSRIFYRLTSTFFSLDVQFMSSLPSSEPGKVYIMNHQSELDLFLLSKLMPMHCSITAKSELKNYPFLGWYLALSGSCVFVNRNLGSPEPIGGTSTVSKVQNGLMSLFIFPEGTRSRFNAPGLLPFKNGAFYFAVEAQVPIVPIVVANYSEIFNYRKKKFGKGTIKVKVLDSLNIEEMPNQGAKSLALKAYDEMYQACMELGMSKNLY